MILKKINNYYYIGHGYPCLVWRNVLLFAILHALYLHGFYLSLFSTSWSCWLFVYCYAVFGGLGITAGAHRLWSHKSYKARLPLRTFLMLCNCIAGQNDLIEWCRDHRLHHKASETDADPHNSNRGWFFAHIGWLLQRKHPKVIEMGQKLDLSDLRADPVLRFQRRFYWPLALSMGLLLPVSVCHLCFGETLWNSLCIGIWRYVTSLHCTWFVNSAAHIWGSQDYDSSIEPRESGLVSLGALGEGFHNYHHTFPYDYSTSEHGGYINFTTIFIDLMKSLGLAHSLRCVNREMIEMRRARTGTARCDNDTILSRFVNEDEFGKGCVNLPSFGHSCNSNKKIVDCNNNIDWFTDKELQPIDDDQQQQLTKTQEVVKYLL